MGMGYGGGRWETVPVHRCFRNSLCIIEDRASDLYFLKFSCGHISPLNKMKREVYTLILCIHIYIYIYWISV